MFTKEQLIEELKNKSKTQIAKEHDITRKKVLQLEKELGIKKEDYVPIYQNEEKLRQLVEEYGTASEVARQLSLSKTVVSQWCKKFGIVSNYRTHTLDENYFSIIDTEHKAYWLGFLMADGSMDKTCTKWTLNISSNDEYMLSLLLKDLNSTSTIKHSINNGFEYSRILICSLKMCKDLIYHGIVPHKSGKEILPNTIPNDLVRHFIRGYMDGDGSIVVYDRGKSAIRLDFAGMSYNIFYSIHKHLLNNNIIDCNIIIKQENNSNCNHLNYHCANAIKILDYLYKDATIYLERKYLKYKEKISSAL